MNWEDFAKRKIIFIGTALALGFIILILIGTETQLKKFRNKSNYFIFLNRQRRHQGQAKCGI